MGLLTVCINPIQFCSPEKDFTLEGALDFLINLFKASFWLLGEWVKNERMIYKSKL